VDWGMVVADSSACIGGGSGLGVGLVATIGAVTTLWAQAARKTVRVT